MQAQPKKRDFKGDKEGSTYRWELHLTNGYTFDGYSKNIGQAEKQDKEALLQDCIARLLNCGYLDKCYQMFFYKREFMHKSNDTLLLEMYGTYYIAHKELNFRLPTTQFLDRIYNARLSGTGFDYKGFLPERPVYRSQDKIDFEFSLSRFPTLDTLIAYCADYLLREQNYGRQRVEAWYHKVRHNYSGQSLPVASPTVRPASVDLTPAPQQETPTKAQQQAMNTVNTLYGKFQSNR